MELKCLPDGGWLLGPLAVCGSTVLLVAHATARPVSAAGVVLFAAGVVAAYALDHWVDLPPARRSPLFLYITGLAALTGLMACLWLPGWKIALATALGVVGLSYRSWKKWPLVKTLLIAGAWTAAGVGLPIAWDTRDLFFASFGGALFALFAADALLCDFKDGAADARAGVRTAVVLWGRRTAAIVAAGLAMGGVIAALAAGRPGLAAAGLMLAGLAAFPNLISRPVLGPALVDGALVLPAVLILAGLA